MELVSLDVERFGCVARASVAFKPGLNVLHGSNEVGKSSIARAIRFALLLPPSSSAVDPWIPWNGGGDPMVTLVFRNGANEYYRVKKTFGSNTASLERSSDGAGWANLARAREVESRLRSLLQWGIPEPGGANAPKGLPESFLASALLADQDEVSSIFEQDLEDDGVDSGRVRVRAALQAMAQDPLFKSVLDAAQARVDEAFSPSGQRRRGANHPFKRMADDVAARQKERDEAEQAAIAGRLLGQRVAALRRDAAAVEGDLQGKILLRETLEQRRQRQNAFAAAAAARKAAQAHIDAVTEAEEKAVQAAEVLRDLEPLIPDLRKSDEEARRTLEAAKTEMSAARETRKSQLASEETAILREREVLRFRRVRLEGAFDLRKADELHTQGKVIENALKTLDSEIAVLEMLEPWGELRATRKALETATDREKKAINLVAKADELRTRAATAWPTSESKTLPDSKLLTDLRNLRRNLEVAEARLDVGLSVQVRGAPSVAVSTDGAATEKKAAPFAIEANVSARLDFGDGIEILVEGGRAADRSEAERHRTDWRQATASLFATSGAADLAQLEEKCRLDAENKGRAESLVREAQSVDAERIALGNPKSEIEHHSVRIAELQDRIQDEDVALIEAAAVAHGAHARVALNRKNADRESKRGTLAALRAQEGSLRERLAAHTHGEPIAGLDMEAAALEVARQDSSGASGRSPNSGICSTHRQSRTMRSKTPQGRRRRLSKRLSREFNTAQTEYGIWKARLEERHLASAGIDIETLRKAEDRARVAASNDGPPVDDTAVFRALGEESTARNQHETLVGELRKAEGALDGSGGAAADERLSELDAALQRAHEKQAALEDEYEAWRLLTDALKDAERNQATHLGNVLAPDLASRFQALVGQRYSGISLSPHLGLEGIDAGGGSRDLERLSIGTREQLSTLFRLCLAERLRSALLLDDQLVQSDPDRLRWFRQALRQTAATGVQVVVLTCRPDDYLEPAEMPPPTVIDLGAVVMGELR